MHFDTRYRLQRFVSGGRIRRGIARLNSTQSVNLRESAIAQSMFAKKIVNEPQYFKLVIEIKPYCPVYRSQIDMKSSINCNL